RRWRASPASAAARAATGKTGGTSGTPGYDGGRSGLRRLLLSLLHQGVEAVPDAAGAVPRALGRGLGIFGGAGLEEVGVFDARQHRLQPRQRVFLDAIDFGQVQLAQAPVGDEADILLD